MAVSRRRPLTGRDRVDATEVAAVPLIAPAPPAPPYWRTAHAPGTLPGPSATTLQGALSLAAAGRGALGLVWQREAETETVGEFARVLAGAAAVREDR